MQKGLGPEWGASLSPGAHPTPREPHPAAIVPLVSAVEGEPPILGRTPLPPDTHGRSCLLSPADSSWMPPAAETSLPL